MLRMALSVHFLFWHLTVTFFIILHYCWCVILLTWTLFFIFKCHHSIMTINKRVAEILQLLFYKSQKFSKCLDQLSLSLWNMNAPSGIFVSITTIFCWVCERSGSLGLKMLVSMEKSCNKEYTCEISKPYNLPFKSYAQS